MARREQLALAAVLICYLVLGVAYSVVTPVGEAPDEIDHARYVQLLASGRGFPVMRPEVADNVTMEANQPPLYYWLSAGVWRLAAGRQADPADQELIALDFAPCFAPDPADSGRKQFYLHGAEEAFPYRGAVAAFHSVRLLSLAMGAGTVLIAYGLGRQIAVNERRLGLLAAGLLAFNPQFLFITGSINNDSLTALLGAATVLMSVSVALKPGRGRLVALALLLGLGALTKLALFALWPVALLGVLLAVRQPDQDIRTFVRRLLPAAALLLLIPALTAGWWYLRAQVLYGDPLVWDVHLAAKGASIVRDLPFGWSDLAAFIRLHFRSYWATFGWLNIELPESVYRLLVALTLLACFGLLLVVRDLLRRRKQPAAERSGPARLGELSLVALLLNGIAVLGVYLSLLRYVQTINYSGYQGRLAYAAAAPIAAILAVGMWRLGGRALAWLSTGSLVLLALVGLFGVLAPAYARPLIYQPEFVDTRPCIRLGDWQVEGVSGPERVLPGESLDVTLHGYGLANNPAAPLSLDLVGRGGSILAQIDERVAVAAGQAFSVTLSLSVAEPAEPALGLVRLAAPDDAGLLPLTNARGQALETPYPLAWVKIAPQTPVIAAPQLPVAVRYGDALTLLGHDVAVQGDDVALILYWQADADMADDYAFFVHVLNAAGEQIAQWDSQPQGGAYPTSIWDVAEVVAESINLTLPEGAVLAVGAYDPATGLRLPAVGADGERLPDDRYLLAIRR